MIKPNIKKTKRKINKLNMWALIVSGIAMFAFVCILIGVIVLAVMLKDKPKLDINDFEQSESSIIYDRNGDEVANLGTVIRKNVSYNEMPNVVTDAFVAIEDSRFFEHNGFDLPRFTKAIIENIITFDFGQGGSTFTMQLVKNTYFTNDETGEEASRSGMSGIKRKVCEIALALELEKYEPKQFIFESYINKLNYGGERNIRGIQKAAQYYFGKNVDSLNINEAALLAGVINAPNYYNPFNNLEACQERTNTVLYQMYNHGYITKTEYQLAKSVRVEDLLADPHASKGEGDGISYQSYVDAVVNEVIDLTGLDPYTTTMNIYTYMNKDIQATYDAIQADSIRLDENGDPFILEEIEYDEDGNEIEYESYLKYPDDFMEVASVCINNSTGEVVAIMGGRNYANGGQLLLNHATEQKKNPGSSIKPILDYALAFENLGWATDHVLTDAPQYMDSSHKNLVYNYSGKYVGDVTLKQAVGDSINTCAIQTLQAVLDKMKYEYVVNYCQSLGYDFNLDKFNVQYGIGGSTCEVTPYQHAAAYAAIMNYGTYNTPHTIKRIEFTNGKSPITPVYSSAQVLSDAASYLTTELMYSNAEYYGGSYSYVKNPNYTVYAKTGTTDWAGSSGAEYGIPAGATRDCWLVASTTEYTTATWVGYEKAVLGQPSYVTDDVYYNVRPQARIAHLALDACYEYGENKPSKFTKPSGVTSVTHILGTWPYASTKIDGVELDESLITTGLAKSGTVSLVSLSAPTISANPKGSTASVPSNNSSSGTVVLEFERYPDSNALDVSNDTKDQSLKDSSGNVIVPSEGKVLFDYSWIYGPIRYCADISVKYADGNTKTYSYKGADEKALVTVGDLRDGYTMSIDMYYKYDNASITSAKENIEIKSDMQYKTLSKLSSQSLSSVKEWCTNNGVKLEVQIIDTNNDKLVIKANGTDITSELSSSKQVPLSSSITCTYNIYFKLEASPNTVTAGSENTIRVSPISNLLTADGTWKSGFDSNELSNDNGVLVIKPNSSRNGSYNVDYTVDGYTASITINVEPASSESTES